MKAGLKKAGSALPLSDSGRREYHLSNPTSVTGRSQGWSAPRLLALRTRITAGVPLIGDGRAPLEEGRCARRGGRCTVRLRRELRRKQNYAPDSLTPSDGARRREVLCV